MSNRDNDDSVKIISIVFIFAIVALLAIATRALQFAEKIINPEPSITQSTMTPKVSLPNPHQYYFIDCVDGDIGVIIDKKGDMWYYKCEQGKWKGSSRI